MPNRGLWTRLCPTCAKVVSHRTLYVKTESNGRTRWLRIFWACTACSSLNHVTLPVYRLRPVRVELPTPLSVCTVEALKHGPKSVDQLVEALRGNCPGVRHVFRAEVGMVLEYLKTRGRVVEEMQDLTERAMAEFRNRRASSSHLGQCPAEAARGVVIRGVVSVYAQYRQRVAGGDEPTRTGRPSLAPVGFLCVSCGYHQIDQALIAIPSRRVRGLRSKVYRRVGLDP